MLCFAVVGRRVLALLCCCELVSELVRSVGRLFRSPSARLLGQFVSRLHGSFVCSFVRLFVCLFMWLRFALLVRGLGLLLLVCLLVCWFGRLLLSFVRSFDVLGLQLVGGRVGG